MRTSESAVTEREMVIGPSREDTMTDWLNLIRGEYHETPGLHLTKSEVQRLWNLDASTCAAILQALETDKFLRRTHTGAYVKANG